METKLKESELAQLFGGDHYEYVYDENGNILMIILVKD